jgi:hypothetical protein
LLIGARSIADSPARRSFPKNNCVGPGNPYADGGYDRNAWRDGHAFMEHRWRRHHRTQRE